MTAETLESGTLRQELEAKIAEWGDRKEFCKSQGMDGREQIYETCADEIEELL